MLLEEYLKTGKNKFNYFPFLHQLFRDKVYRFTSNNADGKIVVSTSLFLDGDILIEAFSDGKGNLLAEKNPKIVDRHYEELATLINSLQSFNQHVKILSVLSGILFFITIELYQIRSIIEKAGFPPNFSIGWFEIAQILWPIFGSLILTLIIRFLLKRLLFYFINRI